MINISRLWPIIALLLVPAAGLAEEAKPPHPSEVEGAVAVAAAWKGLLETLGRRVEVRWGDEIHVGAAEDVDTLGALLLRRDDGLVVTLPAGEVTSHLD